MEFKEVFKDGQKRFFIDNKEVSKNCYDSLKEEYDVSDNTEDEMCPICAATESVLEIFNSCEDSRELYDVLHEYLSLLIDSVQSSAYESLGNHLLEISKEMLEEE